MELLRSGSQQPPLALRAGGSCPRWCMSASPWKKSRLILKLVNQPQAPPRTACPERAGRSGGAKAARLGALLPHARLCPLCR